MCFNRWLFVLVIAYFVLAVICLPLKTSDDDTKADGQLSSRLRRSIGSLSLRRSKRMNAVAPDGSMSINIPFKKAGMPGKPGPLDNIKDKIKGKADPSKYLWKIFMPILYVIGAIIGLIGLCGAAACIYFCCIRESTPGRPRVIFVGKNKNKRDEGEWEEEDAEEDEEEEEEQPEPTTKNKCKTKAKSKSKAKLKSKAKKAKSKSKSKPKLKAKSKATMKTKKKKRK